MRNFFNELIVIEISNKGSCIYQFPSSRITCQIFSVLLISKEKYSGLVVGIPKI